MSGKTELLDALWSEFDHAKHGYIYGKDLPHLMEKTLAAIDNKDRIDQDKMSLLQKFAKDQGYVKIYKVVLDDTLQRLLGQRYDDIVGNARIINIPINYKPDDLPKLPSQNTDHEEVEQLRKEIMEKENIIKNKEQKMTQLQESVSHYKEKYLGLVEEFKFYKQTIEKKEKVARNVSTVEQSNEAPLSSKRNFDLRNEFFIEEFKRQIDEQTKIINKLKTQIKNNPSLGAKHWKQTPQYSTNMWQNIPIFISRQYTWFLIIVTLLGLISSVYFKVKFDDDQIVHIPDSQTSWLHSNPLTNTIRWLVSVQPADEKESGNAYKPMSDQDIDAYNQIFARGVNII